MTILSSFRCLILAVLTGALAAQPGVPLAMGQESGTAPGAPSTSTLSTGRAKTIYEEGAPSTHIKSSRQRAVYPSTRAGKSNRIITLAAEKCGETDAVDQVGTWCEWDYSDGSKLKAQTYFKSHDKTVHILTEQNAAGREKHQTTVVRSKIQGRDGRQSELTEILVYKDSLLISREEAVTRTNIPGGGSELEWAQYSIDPISGDSSLIYQVRLGYDSKGRPFAGIAGKWRHGYKTADFLNWNRRRDGTQKFQRDNWQKWETWVKNITLHAIFN